MTKAELTAESRSIWVCGKYPGQPVERETSRNEGSVKILVVPPHMPPLVHGAEVKLGIFVLDELDVHAHGFLDAVLNQFGNSNISDWPS